MTNPRGLADPRHLRLSVVIIVFNLEPYIGQAIDSVLAQTRPADEIIVVDDCSTDRSADVVAAYGSNVRYLRMPKNSGALLAALHGVKAAGGDVVCMLDGDDYWAANKLAVVERAFSADPALMLLSHDHRRVDAKGIELPIRDETHRNIAAIRRRAISAGDLSNRLKDAILDQTGYWLGSAYSFRRSCFDIPKFERQIAEFGLDEVQPTYLDLVVAPFLVLTNPSRRVGYTPDTHFLYRVHDKGSLAGNLTPEKALHSACKGRRTHALIDFILRSNGASPAQLRRRELLLQEYDFLAALYSGKIGKAATLYARLARRHWKTRELVKETGRMIAVRVLGPARFLKLKG
jgi:glycosyltransferase involved in cell wall biosynthesis